MAVVVVIVISVKLFQSVLLVTSKQRIFVGGQRAAVGGSRTEHWGIIARDGVAMVILYKRSRKCKEFNNVDVVDLALQMQTTWKRYE